MFFNKFLRSWAFLVPALVVLFVQTIHAQISDFHDGQIPIATLDGPWRFHTGDNTAWANPGFDDSHWSLLNADHPWGEQGYKGYGGLAWYRMQIQLPARHKSLALYFPVVDDSCEVFANGHLIGHIGSVSPTPKEVTMTRAIVPIPDNDLVPGQPLLLAIRVWVPPIEVARGNGGGIRAPRIGEIQTISEWSGLQESQQHWRRTSGVIDIYNNILTALAGLGLFALRRKEKEYLWWGISQTLWGLAAATSAYAAFQPISSSASQIVFGSLFLLAAYFQTEFLVSFLRQRRDIVYYAAVLSVLVAGFALASALFVSKVWLAFYGGTVGYEFCFFIFLLRAAKKRNSDAWILLVPYTGMLCVHAMWLLMAIPSMAGTVWGLAVAHFLRATIPAPFPIGVINFLSYLEVYAVLIVLVRRYATSRNDEERMEAELEAARAVQARLVPAQLPAVSGLQFGAVYLPAAEVGGDFYQAFPQNDDSALVVVGDVSGKGLRAAMTGTLVLGGLRSLAQENLSPSQILYRLNNQLANSSDGGFVTCICVRIAPDGSLTVANAGHLAPYQNGEECKVDSGLPLGIVADGEYPETPLQLEPGDTLTLMSDGVVEAQDAGGELFGFERTQAISDQSAEEIAAAAQQFGQQDDISVLTIAFAPAAVLQA